MQDVCTLLVTMPVHVKMHTRIILREVKSMFSIDIQYEVNIFFSFQFFGHFLYNEGSQCFVTFMKFLFGRYSGAFRIKKNGNDFFLVSDSVEIPSAPREH